MLHISSQYSYRPLTKRKTKLSTCQQLRAGTLAEKLLRGAALFLALSLFLVLPFGSALACPDIDGLADINCDGKVQIACFGDSITFGRADELGIGYPGRLLNLYPNTVILNLGVPGEKTPAGKRRATQQFATFSDSDYVIVLEGVNDYFIEGRSATLTKDNVLKIVQAAQSIGAVTLLGNLTAIRRSEQKGWVSAVNNRLEPHRQIDFFSLGEGIISGDLLHPNGLGYDRMALLVSVVLNNASAANRPLDVDMDGIYDFAEVRFGTSTLSADTDLDGLLDGAEVFTHGSSPLLLDSDGDGFSDPQEVAIGANPADPRPSPPTISTLEAVLP